MSGGAPSWADSRPEEDPAVGAEWGTLGGTVDIEGGGYGSLEYGSQVSESEKDLVVGADALWSEAR